MLVNVTDLETNEIVYEKLDVKDVMYGSSENDDRTIVFLPSGGPLIFAPQKKYLISAYVEPEPEPEPEPEETEEEIQDDGP